VELGVRYFNLNYISCNLMALRRLAAGGLGIALGLTAPTVAFADKSENVDSKAMQRLFDPEALERGATALKEINKSPFAKQVLVERTGVGDGKSEGLTISICGGQGRTTRIANQIRHAS
jgi:hypothetical protein